MAAAKYKSDGDCSLLQADLGTVSNNCVQIIELITYLTRIFQLEGYFARIRKPNGSLGLRASP